jgi:nitrogenase molybdenum-iron protein alpha/beta subunit
MTTRDTLIQLAATQLHGSDVNADNAHEAIEHIVNIHRRFDGYYIGISQTALTRLINDVIRAAQKRANLDAAIAARRA